MRTKTYRIQRLTTQESVLEWLYANFNYVLDFRGNGYSNGFDNYIFASNTTLEHNKTNLLKQTYSPLKAGFLSYDLKNSIEDLESNNPSQFTFPVVGFIEAEIKFKFTDHYLVITSEHLNIDSVIDKIKKHKKRHYRDTTFHFEPQTSQENYYKNVNDIKKLIEEGEVYEMCYCNEFLSDISSEIAPTRIYEKLNSYSPKPFANFIKWNHLVLIGASPERFLKSKDNKLISQPIKGTAKRGITYNEDLKNKARLKEDSKERAENLMIVDLVRNDFARCAIPGTINVDELFGIYTFPYVHQMISTISAQINPSTTGFNEIIRATFPMGSMTGAPKINAMKFIDQFENFKRGLYSGSVGYFTESGFDFNVVIRSIQLNLTTNKAGIHVGSAITYDSTAENEFEECNTKATSVTKSLET